MSVSDAAIEVVGLFVMYVPLPPVPDPKDAITVPPGTPVPVIVSPTEISPTTDAIVRVVPDPVPVPVDPIEAVKVALTVLPVPLNVAEGWLTVNVNP